MSWARRVVFRNWRNKGVALFFALTIWYVAFQSEKQDYLASFRVKLTPANPEERIITSVKRRDQEGSVEVDFDERVLLEFAGPRKEIEDLRDRLRLQPQVGVVNLEIPADKETFLFRPEDFGFPRRGVEVVRFTPASVRVTQEPAESITVENMEEHVRVTDWKEGYEVARKKVDPLAVAIRGPRSIISAIHPTVTVSMGYDREHFEGIAPVKLAYPEEIAALVEKTVKVVPLQVRVEVELKPKIETLSAAAVRITFRIPPPELPIKIYVDELSGGTIPVEFYGPRDRIGRLADRLKEPGFALAVRVPSFDIEPGETREFTFTEESLEIYGFPDIQLRPHESRRTLKRPWTYRLVAVKEAEK